MFSVEWIFSIVVTVGVFILAYWCVKNQWLDSVIRKASVFAVLWILGWLIYVFVPVAVSDSNCICGRSVNIEIAEKKDPLPSKEARYNATRPLSAANRVTSTFFPSRGGYETVASDGVMFDGPWPWFFEFIYYLFHLVALVYVGLLLLSIFGRHLIDKIRRAVRRGDAWTVIIRWVEKCYRHMEPWKLREEMCVFWGDPESARILAENLRTDNGVKGLGFVPKILFLLPGWLKYEDSSRASILRLSDKGYVLDFVDGLPSDDDKYNVVGKEFELEDEDVAGRRHFLLSENSAYNIGLANAIIKKRSDGKGAYVAEKLDIYIRVENSASSGVLKDWADAKMKSTMKSVTGEVNIHIFRETEVMAERFIRDYPILRHRFPGGNDSCGWLLEGAGDQGVVKTRSGKDGLDVLIVGFGNRGQELLNIMLENSQFLGADDKVIPMRFAILDKCEIDGKYCASNKCSAHEVKCPAYEAYARRSPEIAHPPAGSAYSVVFNKIDGDVSEDGFEHFGIKVSDYDRIVVCTGNDELNAQIGEVVRREFVAHGVKLESGRLFVQLQSNDVAEREMDKNCPVQYFGMWKNIFTYEGIVDEGKYYGARLLNWRYNYEEEIPPKEQTYKKDEKGEYVLKDGERVVVETVKGKWRETKWFDKESSVASYRGMLNILALMGYGLVDRDNSPKEDVGEKFGEMVVDPKSEIWGRLAKVEHLRWMAFMRTHGVRSWDLTEPSIEEVDRVGKIVGKMAVKPNVRELIGRHGALADYDDLPKVNMRLAKYNGMCNCCENDFTREGIVGRKGHRDNLQWNDMKFVMWIPVLFSELWEDGNKGKRQKIVKVGD